ncbi:MAG: (Fe-S)-binding protein [Nitrincola lacisaponensis]|uniref:(Fe-S)-binding protein n=1 Tax=Nitrincola lacisaponensis TaxID=267850 RepID=UPI00391CA3D0
MKPNNNPPVIGLFITCLADLYRPEVGFATIKLLEQAGCRVEVPEQQTCCGQPAFNSGDFSTSADIARQTIAALDGYAYVVAPSGSCISMLHHYPELFDDQDPWKARAESLKARAYEITSFLVDVLHAELSNQPYSGTVTYHDSCSGLRELGIKQQPRQLLAQLEGVELKEMEESETCCGFGGTFCVKYPDISNRMVSNKTDNIVNAGAKTLLGGDLGCLLNMAGKLQRQGHAVEVRHVVEVLAGMTDQPALGETQSPIKAG